MDVANRGGMIARILIYFPLAIALITSSLMLATSDQTLLRQILALDLMVINLGYGLLTLGLLIYCFWKTRLRTWVLSCSAILVSVAIVSEIPGFDILGMGYEPINLLYLIEIAMMTVIARFASNQSRSG